MVFGGQLKWLLYCLFRYRKGPIPTPPSSISNTLASNLAHAALTSSTGTAPQQQLPIPNQLAAAADAAAKAKVQPPAYNRISTEQVEKLNSIGFNWADDATDDVR